MLNFDNIFGQDGAIDQLRRAYLAQRLPHGLVFAGPVGVGKATTARALAALFLCERPQRDVPCGKCASCRAIAADAHPDYHVITKELIRYHDKTGKSKGIDLSIHVLRPELVAKAALKPVMNVGKVFVVEQADLMNAQAQNAILKTLEEPAGRAVIVLLTDQLNALLPTIRSRCQVVQFAALGEGAVREQLIKGGVSKDDATRAAALSEGSLGLAMRWLEDGVVDGAGELERRLEAIESSGSAGDLDHWFKKAADDYATRQLARDPLGSKDQATREALALYLRLAAQRFRRRLGELEHDPAALEQACGAIDAIVLTEEYVDANVSVALALQQLAVNLERQFAPAGSR